MCNNSCNECSRKIYTDSVSVVTVDGVSTLVLDVPAQTFRNCQKGCMVIIQNIPDTATINMPVAISIGGDTTTVYDVLTCDCSPVVACQLRTRRRYPFVVKINGTTATFRILKNLSCAPSNNSATIPVAAAGDGG